MHVLLAEPDYYTRFPPLGLLKLSSYHKLKGDTTELIRGKKTPRKKPDLIYVTSLFTYSWKPVHESVNFFKKIFPNTKAVLGGIYASLMPDHAALSGADEVHMGLFDEAEKLLPDYSLVPQWDGSFVFTTRGCVRKCSYCSVPKLEGKLKVVINDIKPFIYPGHSRVIIWDNNFFATSNCYSILDQLKELELKVDFNQGLDIRLLNEKIASKLSQLNIRLFRFAYDEKKNREAVRKGIKRMDELGIRKRKLVFYVLYNYNDGPEDFFKRIRDLLEWGVAAYPMRYQPLDCLEKNSHISPLWTEEEIKMVAKAQRVLGFSGAFPPYEGLIKKFLNAKDFDDAFKLRPIDTENSKVPIPNKINLLKRKSARYGGILDWREIIKNERTEFKNNRLNITNQN